MENRLATIVFIDMQGYTKRSAGQTIEEMKRFHDEFHGFVKDHLERHAGILVKTLGDGFLARFDAPTKAVQCAHEMQRKLMARNEDMLNPDKIVRFRIGINTGEVGIDESGDLFGDPVNIASRIQSFAEPNEVYISEATYLAMNRNEFGAADLGPQQFKNATREIKVYKVLPKGTFGSTAPAAKAAPLPDQRNLMKKIAVGVAVLLLLALAANGVRRAKLKAAARNADTALAQTPGAAPDAGRPVFELGRKIQAIQAAAKAGRTEEALTELEALETQNAALLARRPQVANMVRMVKTDLRKKLGR